MNTGWIRSFKNIEYNIKYTPMITLICMQIFISKPIKHDDKFILVILTYQRINLFWKRELECKMCLWMCFSCKGKTIRKIIQQKKNQGILTAANGRLTWIKTRFFFMHQFRILSSSLIWQVFHNINHKHFDNYSTETFTWQQTNKSGYVSQASRRKYSAYFTNDIDSGEETLTETIQFAAWKTMFPLKSVSDALNISKEIRVLVRKKRKIRKHWMRGLGTKRIRPCSY